MSAADLLAKDCRGQQTTFIGFSCGRWPRDAAELGKEVEKLARRGAPAEVGYRVGARLASDSGRREGEVACQAPNGLGELLRRLLIHQEARADACNHGLEAGEALGFHPAVGGAAGGCDENIGCGHVFGNFGRLYPTGEVYLACKPGGDGMRLQLGAVLTLPDEQGACVGQCRAQQSDGVDQVAHALFLDHSPDKQNQRTVAGTVPGANLRDLFRIAP